ncbi:hypothetical protein [uncultured Pelagimonas sp.]|uniref:hypothetical protein n=1 Tax=uncultured Pelagimonas sp. TaxID=1618102 RepID=UPI0026330919|nr:hypothetical protein [uncultured Pelagimonas sp.]
MKDHIIRIGIAIVVCAAIVAGAQTLPALTEPSVSSSAVAKMAKRSAFRPRQFCAASMSGVDCACFEQKAAQILATKQERIWGWSYANQLDLAIEQGREGCSS